MTRKRTLNASSVPNLLVELADKVIADERYDRPTVVTEFIDRMDVEAPGLIDSYVVDNRVRYLLGDFGQVLDRRRALSRQRPGSQSSTAAGRNARAGRFADGVDAAVAGGQGAISVFLATCSVDGTDVAVGAMRGEDHLWVADMTYGPRARTNLMLESFHRAVAKKCGLRRTDEVFTEEQYQKLYRSVVKD